MEQLLDQIFILADNHFVLFIIIFLASLAHAFLPFIPVEAGSMCAGYMVSLGHGSIPVIIISATLGMTVGHLFIYHLALRHGEAVMAMRPFNKLFSVRRYIKMKTWFMKYGVWSLFIAKVVPGMSFCSVLCCGVFRFNEVKAVGGILGSNLFQFTCLVFLGKMFGEHWKEINALINGIGGVFLLLIIIAGVYLLLRYKFGALRNWVRTKHR